MGPLSAAAAALERDLLLRGRSCAMRAGACQCVRRSLLVRAACPRALAAARRGVELSEARGGGREA